MSVYAQTTQEKPISHIDKVYIRDVTITASIKMIFRSWGILPHTERTLCVGAYLPRTKLGGMNVWKPSGCLLVRWEEEIEHTVTEILCHEENQSLLGRTSSASLFMLSEAGKDKARPYVVCFNKKEKKAEDAVRSLKDHRDMRVFEFSYLAAGMRILTNDYQFGVSHDDRSLSSDDNLCGKHILACPIPITESTVGKRATMGGVLKFGPHGYYGLTSAHTFFNSFDKEKESGKSSLDSGTSSMTGEDSGSESDLNDSPDVPGIIPDQPSIHGIYCVERHEHHSTKVRSLRLGNSNIHVGNVFYDPASPAFDYTKFYCPERDWALFEIVDPRFWGSNAIRISEHQSLAPRPGYNRTRPPDGDLLVLSGPSGVVEGTGVGIKSSINLPWSTGFVEAWLIACELEVGSCGSWVIEAQSGIICGIIIASSPGVGLSWMLPADPIFTDILEKWGSSYQISQHVFQLPENTPIDLPIIPSRSSVATDKGKGKQSSLRETPHSDDSAQRKAEGIRLNRLHDLTIAGPESSEGYAPSILSSASSRGPLSNPETMAVSESSKTSVSGGRTPLAGDSGPLPDLKDVPLLSDVAHRFVNCPDTFPGCYAFIQHTPDVLSLSAESFMAAASAAQARGDEIVARSCVKRAIMLKDLREYTSEVPGPEVLQDYFQSLINNENTVAARFFRRLDEILVGIRKGKPTGKPKAKPTGNP